MASYSANKMKVVVGNNEYTLDPALDYTSKPAAQGGTEVSLVTTGEKYNWNNSGGGTITGITMNGQSKGNSGVVDLGTVITAHQDISGKADSTNVVTRVTRSGTTFSALNSLGQTLFTFDQQDTNTWPTNVSQLNNDAGYLTAHQDLSPITAIYEDVGPGVVTVANGATVFNDFHYSKANKRAGIVALRLRMTLPEFTGEYMIVGYLTDKYIPYADYQYFPCYSIWSKDVIANYSIMHDGSIVVFNDASGKDIQILITYIAANL